MFALPVAIVVSGFNPRAQFSERIFQGRFFDRIKPRRAQAGRFKMLQAKAARQSAR
jgi:transposase